MATQANVGLFNHEFIATLSDGRRIDQSDLRGMAGALHQAGVTANGVCFEWCSGQRMVTAGQQVALRAEIRKQEQQMPDLPHAA